MVLEAALSPCELLRALWGRANKCGHAEFHPAPPFILPGCLNAPMPLLRHPGLQTRCSCGVGYVHVIANGMPCMKAWRGLSGLGRTTLLLAAMLHRVELPQVSAPASAPYLIGFPRLPCSASPSPAPSSPPCWVRFIWQRAGGDAGQHARAGPVARMHHALASPLPPHPSPKAASNPTITPTSHPRLALILPM